MRIHGNALPKLQGIPNPEKRREAGPHSQYGHSASAYRVTWTGASASAARRTAPEDSTAAVETGRAAPATATALRSAAAIRSA